MRSWQSPDIPHLDLVTAEAADRVRVHDTATGGLVEVGPTPGYGPARMYVCGITPYDATHLGHANTYVAFDLLNRTWRDLGLPVLYAQNVTDVDDPLLERAQATGQDWEELASSQIDLFRCDMEALRVIPPAHYIGATECIPCVLGLVEDLRAKSSVYQIQDRQYPDWYFRSDAAPGFLEVSHVSRQEALAVFAERGGDPDRPGKHDPLDCLVWMQARPGEPAWDSPLGRGRPGWHIECTAIAMRYLGPGFDVQGGGSDLAFPHHEMCAAEGVMASDEQFASAFVHSGMVGLGGRKMSKSLGNLELVSRLRGHGVPPMAIRLALLAHHYRSDWEWTNDQITLAKNRLALWRRACGLDRGLPASGLVSAVRTAMRTDLDAPTALALVDRWATDSLQGGTDADAPGQVRTLVDALLGVRLTEA